MKFVDSFVCPAITRNMFSTSSWSVWVCNAGDLQVLFCVYLLLKLAVNERNKGGRNEGQADCPSEEVKGRGVICSNILWISPRRWSCQSDSQEAGICHRIVAMAMTSMLMSQCDTWKYNKQTAGIHTHATHNWVSEALRDMIALDNTNKNNTVAYEQ